MSDKFRPRQRKFPKKISPHPDQDKYHPDQQRWAQEAAERQQQDEFWSDSCWRDPGRS